VDGLPGDLSRYAGREVQRASSLKSAKLPVEGDARSLGSVVRLAEGLSIRDVSRTATAVRMDVVRLEPFSPSAASGQQAPMLTSATRSGQDHGLVATGEPPDRIPAGGRMRDGVDDSNRRDQQEEQEPSEDPR
jgi:hypothetical protein